jgi:predicted amidohydrolase
VNESAHGSGGPAGDLRVAAIQYRPPKRDPTSARAELGALFEQALQSGARVVVAPEMATTGYVWKNHDEVRPLAEDANGPTRAMLHGLAERYDATLVAGFVERCGDTLFNAAHIVSAGREPAVYRKRLLFDLDMVWAVAGDRYLTIDTPLGRATPAICMDLNDDRFVAYIERERPDAVLFCANWVDQGVDIIPYWRARLGRWSGWFVAANTWGTERGVPFRGHSTILAPGGRVAAQAAARGNTVVLVDTAETVPSIPVTPSRRA